MNSSIFLLDHTTPSMNLEESSVNTVVNQTPDGGPSTNVFVIQVGGNPTPDAKVWDTLLKINSSVDKL